MLLYCLFLLVVSLLLVSLCSHDTIPLYVFLLKCCQTPQSANFILDFTCISWCQHTVSFCHCHCHHCYLQRLTYYVTIFGSLFTLFDNIYACILYRVHVFTELLRTVVLIILLHLFELLALTGRSKTFYRCKECWWLAWKLISQCSYATFYKELLAFIDRCQICIS